MGTNVGSEIDGKNDLFERPVLILNKMRSDLALIIPVTSRILEFSDRMTAIIAGKKSQLVLSQSRTVSAKRLLRRIGYLKKDIFQEAIIRYAVLVLKTANKSETPH
ncbi:type II toxin-antitoxin system PemK/MazF family toxin [Patescibacteria group bacterium]|nr:type II toxin-antitoxin system PemK/MazF family toxin [Patescibacteria group bacterium]